MYRCLGACSYFLNFRKFNRCLRLLGDLMSMNAVLNIAKNQSIERKKEMSASVLRG